jgi:dipeptidyl aminopeptidase/acylaminoacyl peptidase
MYDERPETAVVAANVLFSRQRCIPALKRAFEEEAMTKLVRSAWVVLCLLALMTAPALGQEKKKGLDNETMFDMESLSNPEISPDGKQIVFSRSWVDKVKDQQRSNLWIIDVNGERLRELTVGPWRDSSPTWSPDGKRIAFLSDRDGTNQIHVLWVDTREVAQITRAEFSPSNVRWSPDGKWIAYTGFDDKLYTNHVSSLYLMDANGGGKKLWAGNLPSGPSNVTVTVEDQTGRKRKSKSDALGRGRRTTPTIRSAG